MVRASSSLALRSIDLSRADGSEPEYDIDALLRSERQEPFDYAQGPLARFAIIKLSPKTHVFVASVSALCIDAWSLGNLARQLVDLYASASAADERADDTVQYAAYASWQNELLEGEEAEAGRAFWKKLDLLSLPPVQLPYERKADATGSLPSANRVSVLDPRVVEKCRALAVELGTTLEAVSLAVWQSLLGRLTGTQDIVLGYQAHGREYEDLHRTVGPIERCLAVHCHLDGTGSLRQQCAEISQSMEDVREWQDYFTWEGPQPTGTDGEHPVSVPVGFEFTTLPPKRHLADATFSVLRHFTCAEPFHLKLACVETEAALLAEFQYDPRRFSEDEIGRLQNQFSTLLESALESPQAPMGGLDILSPGAQRQILVEFNTAPADFARDRCIHQLFETEAARRPDAIAVVFEQEALSYAQLDERAACLSSYLRTLGVGPAVAVAIRMERSLDMIVGILGVLKAGGAYVPLDPSLPQRRTEALIEDAGVPVLLTHRACMESLAGCTATVIVLDEQWQEIARHTGGTSSIRVTPADAVYTLFTSGSTGTPKGVVVEHQQLANYVHGVVARLDLPSGSTFATVSTIAADLGNTSIFSSLCTGGCLHIIAEARLSDPDAMAEYFDRTHIDCLKIVPSHLDALLASAHPEQILSCGRLVMGGEASSWRLVEKIKKLAPRCAIFNHYGPTETTVGVAAYPFVDGRHTDRSATLPIGRPLAGSQIYLLDANMKPVPIGIAGELHIGGHGLARGYMNRPGQTAERFIPHPFSDQGARLYRTGDLARYQPDGNIEFLGRADHQVKIRGFRIELGEIEAVLGEHRSVRASWLSLETTVPAGARLIAYVVAATGQDLQPGNYGISRARTAARLHGAGASSCCSRQCR